jgi:hypothetical protein
MNIEQMTKEEEQDWKQVAFVQTVSNQGIRDTAWEMALEMHGDAEPALQPADLETARTYIRKCMWRMLVDEIKMSADETLAALWAKGTVGAAKYRVRGR